MWSNTVIWSKETLRFWLFPLLEYYLMDICISVSIVKSKKDPNRDKLIDVFFILNRAAKPVDLGVVLVQLWCNWDGKDGNYGRNGQIVVNSIERMGVVFPHIHDGQSPLTIRSQTPIILLIRVNLISCYLPDHEVDGPIQYLQLSV